MLLKSITIEGFRGYSQTATLNFALPTGKKGSGLTVIVGPNNSGKSTLVEAFRFRRQYGSPSFNVGMRNRLSDSVNITYEFLDHKEKISSIRAGSSEAVVENVKLFDAPVYFVPSRRHFSSAFSKGNPTQTTEFISNYASSNADRSPQINQFEGRLAQIERDQEAFNIVIRELIPDLLSWSIDQHETGQYFLKFSSNQKSHSSEGIGEGVTSTFVITAALYDSSAGDVIVIDEPELSLHPQIQKRLMSLLERYSQDRQIVISTHSPYFVTKTAIEGGFTICRSWDRGGAIKLYELSASSPQAVLRKLVSKNINNPHMFGLDAREVFFLEDGVLVFEGQEDVVLWPEITEQLKVAPMQTFGWGAGGAENIRHVLSVLRGLGFQKVAAVFDADKAVERTAVAADFPEYMIEIIPADDIRSKKTVPERKSKIGLLNDEFKIRGEYIERCKTLVGGLVAAFGKS